MLVTSHLDWPAAGAPPTRPPARTHAASLPAPHCVSPGLFKWATQRAKAAEISQGDAMKTVQRLPGRSWEVVESELERISECVAVHSCTAVCMQDTYAVRVRVRTCVTRSRSVVRAPAPEISTYLLATALRPRHVLLQSTLCRLCVCVPCHAATPHLCLHKTAPVPQQAHGD